MFEFMLVQENQRAIAGELSKVSKEGWSVEHIHAQVSTEDDYGVVWYTVLVKKPIRGEATLSTMPVLGE
jgi:hypothetical protein